MRSITIVGSGLSGLTAGVLLTRAGYDVSVFETRAQIGGNCHDVYKSGQWVHKYGPHIFHTNNTRVWEFLNQFTGFHPYEHRVYARPSGMDVPVPIPINDKTVAMLGFEPTEDERQELFCKGYSRKQWDVEWEELPEHIRKRVPSRIEGSESKYFPTAKYQGIPTNGYSGMCMTMAEEIGLSKFRLSCLDIDWRHTGGKILHKEEPFVFFTGSVDLYYGYSQGHLPYRALSFAEVECNPDDYKCGDESFTTINECDSDIPYTRTTNFAMFPGNKPTKQIGLREFSTDHDQQRDTRFYPKRGFKDGDAIWTKYSDLIKKEKNTLFLGRLGSYAYLDMDQAVANAIAITEKFIKEDHASSDS